MVEQLNYWLYSSYKNIIFTIYNDMVEGCCVISKNSQGLPVYEDLQPLFWKVSIISLQTANVTGITSHIL